MSFSQKQQIIFFDEEKKQKLRLTIKTEEKYGTDLNKLLDVLNTDEENNNYKK